MLHWFKRNGFAFVGAVFAAALLGLSSGNAGLLQPQPIDANTGDDALEVGASFGSRQAWAGFEQPTTGAIKFYVAHAQDGVFAAPQPIDSVTSAALAGNRTGGAVAVYTKKVGAGLVSTLFGRRLSGAQIGPELQISMDTQNVSPLKVHRVRQVAESDAGVAAVCYVDSLTGLLWAAVLGPSSSSWTRYGPLTSKDCSDIAVDAAGDVIVLGQDNGNVATTDRIVGGVLQPGEEVDPTAKDEPGLAVWGNSALVLARADPGMAAFTAGAWKLDDIAAGGTYHSLGNVSPSDWDPMGNYNVEFAKAAVAANGKGIVTFRLGNPGTQTSTDYYETFDASSGLGQPQKLAGESKLADVTPAVDANGNGLATWVDQNGASPEQHIRSLATGAQDFILASSELNATTSFEADAAGDFLVVVERGSSPVHAAAFFADLAKPTLAPTSSTQTPVVTTPVVLHSGAADTFAPPAASAVRWHFPAGSIIGPLDLTGLDVTVTPATVGPVTVQLTATDKGGNTATGQLALKFTAHAKLKVTPAKVKKRARIKLAGKGFAADKAVTLVLLKGLKVKARLGFGLPNGNGGFTRRVRLGKKVRAGRYLVRACQVTCRIKATARLRIK